MLFVFSFQKVNTKKLEKAEQQLQKKLDKKDNKGETVKNKYKSNEASASQVYFIILKC